jgi:myosin heavy subunit
VLNAPKVGKKESRSRTDHFVVKHFAGDVVYHCGEFLDKNNDTLNADFETCLLASSKPLIAEVCKPEVLGSASQRS